MVREYPALVITDARDLSKNSGNPAFADPNFRPVVVCTGAIQSWTKPRNQIKSSFLWQPETPPHLPMLNHLRG